MLETLFKSRERERRNKKRVLIRGTTDFSTPLHGPLEGFCEDKPELSNLF